MSLSFRCLLKLQFFSYFKCLLVHYYSNLSSCLQILHKINLQWCICSRTQRFYKKFNAAVQTLPLEVGNVLHLLYCNLEKDCNMNFREKNKTSTIPNLILLLT